MEWIFVLVIGDEL